MYGEIYYGETYFGGKRVISGVTPITETVSNSATNTPSVAELGFEETLTNSAESTQDVNLFYIVAGEANIIVCEQTATITIEDYDIAYTDYYYNTGVGEQQIVEKIAETSSTSGTATITLEAQDDLLTHSQVNTPSIDDIVNGSVSDSLEGTADNTGDAVVGWIESGLAVHTVLELDLVDVGEDTNPPELQLIYFDSSGTLYLIYNELLDELSVPPTSSYSIDINGTPVTVTGVSVIDNQVQVTTSGTPGYLSLLEISYTRDAIYPVRDLAGNLAANFDTYEGQQPIDPETGDPVPFPFPDPVYTTDPPDPDPDIHGGQILPSFGPAGISLLDISFRAYSFHRKTGIA